MRQEQTDEAYDYCRRVTRRASKTFYWGSMFLPPSKRRAIWAVYAFCRVVDDIVDEAIGDEGEGVRRRAPAEVPFSFILHILASQEVPGCG